MAEQFSEQATDWKATAAKQRLSPRRQAFGQEYIIDFNATQAYIRAGYSEKGAKTGSSRLLAKADVKAFIEELIQKRAEKLELSQEWVLENLQENVNRAMQAVPVLDRDGKPTGEYQYQGQVANRSLELLGRHIGMFSERLEVDATDRLTSLLEAIQARPRPGPVIEHAPQPTIPQTTEQDGEPESEA